MCILHAGPSRQEGRTRRHERGVGCGGRGCDARRAALEADGEVVWSWRPDAGAKFLRSKLLRSDGGKRARSPGRSRISRKNIAWGMPDVSGASAVNTRVHTKTTKRTRGCGCIGHPAFPAPSYSRGTTFKHSPGALRAARSRTRVPDAMKSIV